MFQIFIWFLWEYGEYLSGTAESLAEEMEELAVVAGVNFFCLPFILVFLWFLSKRMLRPLKKIAATSDQIARGELTSRIPVDREQDELGRLASTINQAFDRYQDANEKLNRFSADASHQLRTPLTAMRSTGEICLQKTRSVEEYRDTIESMLEDAAHLTGIAERLLLLSRLESKELQKHFTQVDLFDALKNAANDFTDVSEAKGVTLNINGPKQCTMMGDANLLRQAACNLIDNAIRHTPPGGTITLQTEIEGKTRTGFSITDTGPGISPEVRSRIFDRFSQDRNSHHGSAGLGLAIVSEIVKIHQGSVSVESPASGGSCFRVRFPLATTQNPNH